MPGHSQASKHNWCRGRETDKTATHSSALKVGQWTVLMHQSYSVPKTLNGKKGIKRIRACCPMASLPSYISMVCSAALLGLEPAENWDELQSFKR